MSFTAKYSSGFCYECGLPLVEGDTLSYDSAGELNHTACLPARRGELSENQPALFDLEQARAVQKH